MENENLFGKNFEIEKSINRMQKVSRMLLDIEGDIWRKYDEIIMGEVDGKIERKKVEDQLLCEVVEKIAGVETYLSKEMEKLREEQKNS